MTNPLAHRLSRWLVAACAVAASPLAAQTVVIDNTSPNFWAAGNWHLSTAGTATFVGPNHMGSIGFAPNSLVDNTSPSFSSSAGWTATTAYPNYYGANFLTTGVSWDSAVHIPEIVIDNNLSQNSYGVIRRQSTWPTASAIGGFYGSDYAYLLPTTSASYPKIMSFAFSIRGYGNLGNPAPMTVMAHWPADAGNATNAVIRVRSPSYPSQVLGEYTVNQRQASGTWFTLGNVTLSPGGTYYLEFDATGANGRVVADAVRLVSADVVPAKTAKWTLPAAYGSYDAYVRTPENSYGGAVYGSWTVVGADGSDSLHFPPQYMDGGAWRKIGTMTFNGTQENYILLEAYGGYGANALFADAVMTVPTGTFPQASWRDSTVTGAFNVYASWAAHASRTSAARYKVYTYGANCAAEIKTIIVDQRNSFSPPGLLLGAFTRQVGCPDFGVELTNALPNTTMSADAITIVK